MTIIAKRFKVSRATLYRHLDWNGEPTAANNVK
ncbi:helix-turn-helix domain-containing protein [Spongiactinospora rosea]|nr:helix-turn-helix domain-containing protein [Spongiactinospora rosea]